MILKPRIFFRADGNGQIGLGHVIRSGALAESLGNYFYRVFYTRCVIPAVIGESDNKFDRVVVLDRAVTPEEEIQMMLCDLRQGDVLVLDGYHFDNAYQAKFRECGVLLVSIDDIHNGCFLSDIIINSSGGIAPSAYDAMPHTQFYLGPRYTLLRRAFLDRAHARRGSVADKKLFLCFGGSDPENSTLETLRFIEGLRFFDEVRIVIGSAYRHERELREYIQGSSLNAAIRSSMTAREMAEEMSQCSYAVCSPSTVCYEYMMVGGVLFLKQIATNQDDMIRYLTREKYAFHLHMAGRITPEEEEESLQRQAATFDGKAGERLKNIFQQAFLAMNITIRKANMSDLHRCFDWINEPQVREQSYNGQEISLYDHEIWFRAKLEDPNSYYYILEMGSVPFAQIRFQVSGTEAVLGYLVDKGYRSRGLGTYVLSRGVRAFTNEYKRAVFIDGFVKEANVPSQRSFEKLNFTKQVAAEYPASFKYTMFYAGDKPWC